MRTFLLTLQAVLLTFFSFSQRITDEVISFPFMSANFSVQAPYGDLANRFGINSMIGSSILWKTKSNWILGFEGGYMFSDNVKEDGILDSLKTNNGQILNIYGEYSKVLINQRGFYIGGTIGKIISLSKSNPNSGLLISTSVGILQHKIDISDGGNNSPQIVFEYEKGYDRLTNGLAINEFVGYMFFSKNQRWNFYGGIEFYQSWTQSRRDFDFDLRRIDTEKRNDNLVGLRVGWIIPFYRNVAPKYYY